MKLKFFFLSLFLCFFGLVSSSFAITNSSLASLISSNSSVPSTYKTAMIANVNAGKYVADSRGIIWVPPLDLTSYTGVTLGTNSGGYAMFFYGSSSCDAKGIQLNSDGSAIASYWGTTTVVPVDYYTNSILCSVSGSNNKGGLELFLVPTGGQPQVEAPQQVDLQGLIAAPSGNLMTHFGVTSTTLLVAGIAIFCLLLLVPLIPRLVRSFL